MLGRHALQHNTLPGSAATSIEAAILSGLLLQGLSVIIYYSLFSVHLPGRKRCRHSPGAMESPSLVKWRFDLPYSTEECLLLLVFFFFSYRTWARSSCAGNDASISFRRHHNTQGLTWNSSDFVAVYKWSLLPSYGSRTKLQLVKGNVFFFCGLFEADKQVVPMHMRFFVYRVNPFYICSFICLNTNKAITVRMVRENLGHNVR